MNRFKLNLMKFIQGRIVDQGKFSDLVAKGTDFISLMRVETEDVNDDVICTDNQTFATRQSINNDGMI